MKMTVARPTPCHTSTNATESSAHCGSTSHAGPEIPTTSRAWLIAPFVGCISTWKVRPTPTMLTRTGKKATVRMKPRPMIGPVRSTARSIPMTTLRPRVTDRVDERVRESRYQRRLLEELPVVVEPDELLVEQRPAGEAEVERDERRHEEEDGEDQSSGEEEPVRVGALALAALPCSGARRLAASAFAGLWIVSAIVLPSLRASRARAQRARDGHGVVTSPRGRAAGPASRRPGHRAPRPRPRGGSRSPPRR